MIVETISMAPLWILLVAVACYCRAQDLSNRLCCNLNTKCKNVTTMNIPLLEWTNTSPHYEPILSTDKYSDDYQSVCVTFFPMSDSTMLQFRTISSEKNGITVSQLLVTQLRPGIFRLQGLYAGGGNLSTTVHDSYVVDATCQSCQPLYLYYKCYLLDTCDFIDSPIDVLNGKSSSPDVPSSCLDAFESRAAAEGFNVRGFTRPRGKYSCVAQYLESKCINYDSIAPESRVTYPLQSGCGE